MRGRAKVVAAVVATAALTGCGGGGGDGIVVYTSVGVPFNKQFVQAQQLALAEAGGRAGRFEVTLELLNNQNPEFGFPDPERAARNAREAAEDPRAVAYMGEGTSDATAASLPILNRAGMLMVTPTSSYVGLTRREGSLLPGEPGKYYPTGRRTLGRIIPADHVQAAAVVAYLRREGVRRVGIIHDPGLYGTGLARLVAGRVPGSGVTLVGRPRAYRSGEGRGPESVDADDLVKRAVADGADAIFVSGPLTKQFVTRATRSAPEATFFFPDAVGPPMASPDNEDRLRFTAPRPGQPEAARVFEAKFKAEFGEAADGLTIYAYESMRAILAAIERAGEEGDDRDAVLRSFFALGKRKTPLGTYAITPAGDTTVRTYAAYRVEDGKVVIEPPLRTTALR